MPGKIDNFEAHCERQALRAAIHSTEANPQGLAEENGRKRPQKGDFNGQMSFATSSKRKAPKIIETLEAIKEGGKI